MGKMFDNILKLLAVISTFTTSTLVSIELDFEMPRGFIAKIADILIEVLDIEKDLAALAADSEYKMFGALVRDPDDITSAAIPSNRVDHDVIMDFDVGVVFIFAVEGVPQIIGDVRKERNFNAEGIDVFTARNMRFNIDGAGAQVALLTEARAKAVVHYTLEKISNVDIVNLLDIL